MKANLRDLFWLVLLAATLTVWGIGHYRKVKEIAESRRNIWFVKIDDYGKPTTAELQRQAVLEKMSKLTDEELDSHLASILTADRGIRQPAYEPCLFEMARRGMANKLQAHYDKLMTADRDRDGVPRFPDNIELLTALRRAQGERDPLTLELEIGRRPSWAANYAGPCLQAVVRNVDVGNEAVFFTDGCDDRGGRRERWRFVLTDEKGQRVADSNYCPMMRGGVGTFGPLQHGETGHRINFFELRKYVAPPSSGRYQLEAFYHNDVGIANERDVSGLIVSKSKPIAVIVRNPSPAAKADRRRFDFEAVAILAACAALTAMSVASSKSTSDRVRTISRRDLCWSALVAGLAVAMWLDQKHQAAKVMHARPHAAAQWSIHLEG